MQENGDTVGGRNPAPVDMDKYPVIYKVSCMLGGAGFLPSTVSTYFSYYNDLVRHPADSQPFLQFVDVF